jgi:hypothetical protein
MSEILDSGERREFETGAVRDMQEGKGRCDLMPLEQVAQLMHDKVIKAIAMYQKFGSVVYIEEALVTFCGGHRWGTAHAMLELSKHFEQGAIKYGERNWEKGLPESCYIDSAVRHYLKYLDGQTDEPHDRAVLWNLMCLWWTHKNITEPQEVKSDT